MARILITGASGYIGQAAVHAFATAGWQVRGCGRSPRPPIGVNDYVRITRLAADTDWRAALTEVSCVLHLAGVAHRSAGEIPKTTYETVNADGTESLARAAIAAGVTRFIFMSSIGVNGQTSGAHPFQATAPPNPENAYARSKLHAEEHLRALSFNTNMRYTIVRPPLVYGPNAPGNFARLKRIVERGWPLPVAGAIAPRSYIGLDNLLSALLTIAVHPNASDRTFLLSDGEDVGTADLIRLLARCRGTKARLIRIPTILLRSLARMTGRELDIRRLFDPLQIDSQPIREALDWHPPTPLAEGLCQVFDNHRQATVITTNDQILK